jgi:metallo-beta-lactamase family protein
VTRVRSASDSAVTGLRFLGAAGSVTGSRFLLEAPGARVLLDCGLFQGVRALRRRNWDPFPVDPASLDAVVLSHAHVDHCAYLPALVRHGFRGPVYATPGSAELARIVLPDSGRLQEEDAEYANRKGYSKHSPAQPLYTEEDALAALALLHTVPFGTAQRVAPGVLGSFRPAGHILGSASIHLTFEGGDTQGLLVSGDLGRPVHPLLEPALPPAAADAVLVESTYGDREHEVADPSETLADAVLRTSDRGGVVVIPAFAVDRTELVLHHLRRLTDEGRVPHMPVYVDSPMALAALAVYRRAVVEGWPEIRRELRGRARPFDPGDLREVRSVDASKALRDVDGPAIIVSASGMATGGRVLHHLEQRLPDPRHTVVLVGYQAVGTRGRRLLSGERSLKMHGRYVPVRAEIVDLSGFSVHADRGEILGWLRQAPRAPSVCFVVHGEPEASASLRDAIARELGWNAVVPAYLERVRL